MASPIRSGSGPGARRRRAADRAPTEDCDPYALRGAAKASAGDLRGAGADLDLAESMATDPEDHRGDPSRARAPITFNDLSVSKP